MPVGAGKIPTVSGASSPSIVYSTKRSEGYAAYARKISTHLNFKIIKLNLRFLTHFIIQVFLKIFFKKMFEIF